MDGSVRRSPIFIAAIDAGVFIALWTALLFALRVPSEELPAALAFIGLVSAWIAWRGYVSVAQISIGTMTLRLAATEGFMAGLILFLGAWVVLNAPEVFAAGQWYQQVEPWSMAFVKAAFTSVGVPALLCGLIGSAHAVALYGLNKLLLGANNSLQARRP